MLFLSMRIHCSEVRDPCEFVLYPLSAPLFNGFKKETYEEPCEFDMLAQMRKEFG